MKKLMALLFLSVAASSWAGPDGDGSPLTGKVLESIDAGGYTYLRLETDDGDAWAAIMQTRIPPGTTVTIRDPMPMTDFESKALHRTFKKVYFGSVVDVGTAAPARTVHPAVHGQVAAPTAAIVKPVGKAVGPDAYSIAEIFSQKSQLDGRQIAVRGQVVKFSAAIMNRNWVHLRDGSGSAAEATAELLVTTGQAAAVGDIVVARGVLRTSVDYGAGYSYPVVIEGAALTSSSGN